MTQIRTYAQAGVDIEAGDRAVELMKSSVASASRPEVLGDLGGFSGLFDAAALTSMRRPVLSTATDGVGTKLVVAQALDRHDTIGQDLVAMVTDDLVVTGAEPLFLTDYIACGSVVPERIARIVAGISHGCQLAGCALLGGETAEHGGVMAPDEYDLAAAGTAVVEYDEILGPQRVQPGDVVLAMASSGLHSNGYSLARAVLLGDGPAALERHVSDLGRTLGEELLEPTRIYTRLCLELARDPAVSVRTFSHITGGGLAANLARVLPQTLRARLDRSTWSPLGVFSLIQREGELAQPEMERTFNMGVGMCAVVAPEGVDAALSTMRSAGVPGWVLGEVLTRGADDEAQVTLFGSHARSS
ncbi:MAG: phosphoribosylformylglycinamidine cyclo-ligase [Actinobacteria bacterium]|nr:phosphoribosylformylglycinamidine cyclo-ligase [Actinomycetota bacterium]